VYAAHHFQPTANQIQEAWRSNTKACLLATPSNPAGTCIQSDVVGEIAKVVSTKRGHLIVDEIYQGVSSEGVPLPTMLSKTDDAFIVNSFSKYFGMTGWRLGWLIVPDQAVDSLIRIAQNLFICPSVVAQAAAVAAFHEEAIEEADRRSIDLAQKRRLMSEGLKALGFRIPANPDGAFYLFAEVPEGAPDAEAFCEQALQRVGVAMTPGIDFGDNDTKRFVRISCAQPTSALLDALQRLRGLAP
jgi:aspartate/methionine/tyrosine aminotransferase